MLTVTFLGTAAMAPTRERNTAGVLVQAGSEGILFDCGEGTQRQMRIAGIALTKVTHILISHWHGDHVYGLPGLLQSLAASEYQGVLRIFGPTGTREHLQAMFRLFGLGLKLEVQDVSSGTFSTGRFVSLSAEPLEHDIPCLGYALSTPESRRMNLEHLRKLGMKPGPLMGKLQRNLPVEFNGRTVTPKEATVLVPGKKVVYLSDTGYCNNAVRLAEDADLLISEATFSSELEGKADEYHHLTAKQAASVAKQANVKRLVLTHFSQRFPDTGPLVAEARDLFPSVEGAEDFMRIEL